MARVLMVSHVPLSDRMTAPGIRCIELSRELQRVHDVAIAAPLGSTLDGARVYDPRDAGSLSALMADREVVFSQPLAPRLIGAASRDGRRWVVDMINPDPIEGLEHHRQKAPRLRAWLETLRMDRLMYAATRGSAFACGNERQRDLWLGVLATARRLQAADDRGDRELRGLIDLVPSGVPTSPPVGSQERIVRGPVFPEDAQILLWNGGVWDWLDPVTVVDALAHLRGQDPRWVLLFNGVALPDSGDRHEATIAKAMRAIRGHGFGPDVVYLSKAWTPYRRQGSLLLETDIGVSAHPVSLESHFAFRNRMLDFLWARLPIVCTLGDDFASQVAASGWGETVPPGDSTAFAAAVARVAARGREYYREGLDAAARRYSWSRAADALLGLFDRSVPPPRPISRSGRSVVHFARHSTAQLLGDALTRAQ